MIKKIKIPYGREEIEYSLNINPGVKLKILKPKEKNELLNLPEKIKKELNSPINTLPLKNLATDKKNVCIVIDDITRPLPSRLILPFVVAEIEKGGVKKENIKIIIALGLHRPLTAKEKEYLAGPIYQEIKVFNHNPYKNLKYLTKTKWDSKVYLNRYFLESDLKIIISDIEYHQLFGYGGGTKSIHPGIADADSIKDIHSWLDLPNVEAGVLKGNQLREEIERIGKIANVDFSINVVLNSKKEICGIFCGELSKAFYQGVKLVDQMYRIKIKNPVDTVIVSPGGHPRDIDLYQSQKSVESAKKIVKYQGKIILLAECSEGWGSKLFERWIKQAKNPEEIITRIKKEFFMGAHKAYQWAKALNWAQIYIYSKMAPSELKHTFLQPIELKKINELIKSDKNIVVLPFGTITMPLIKQGKII
jgi:nickel-dependent lactate racemase